jgi:hypothetical protein
MRTAQKHLKQQGMVSILVTMLLMIVITLIVLGFAQISRRNQRQTTDRQLSTQAFYAAETGINDTRNLIKNALAAGTAIPAKPDCTNGSGPTAAFYGGASGLNPTIDAATNVSYSCVIVDPAPTTLAFNDIGPSGTVIPITTTTPIARLNLQWTSKDGTATPTNGCPTGVNAVFSSTAAWSCGYGILRLDLVPTSGALSFAGLQSSTMTSFLVPLRSGGTGTMSFTSNGSNDLKGTSCNDSRCLMQINSGLGGTQYYLRLKSVYKDSGLQITATDASGNPIGIQGSQAVIDVTGKAQDILRRVQVHVPLTDANNSLLPDNAVETTDAICKRFVTMDGYFQSYAASAVSGLTSITSPANPLCQ